MKLWILALVAIVLTACVSDSKYNECLGERDVALTQVGNLESALLLAADEITVLEGELLQRADQTALLEAQVLTCKEALSALNDSCHLTWKANTTRYSFTCADVPTIYPYLDFTAYVCYWQIRDEWGYGKFYSPMDVCVRHNTAGWPESCACVNEMQEIYGSQIGFYYGSIGIQIVEK